MKAPDPKSINFTWAFAKSTFGFQLIYFKYLGFLFIDMLDSNSLPIDFRLWYLCERHPGCDKRWLTRQLGWRTSWLGARQGIPSRRWSRRGLCTVPASPGRWRTSRGTRSSQAIQQCWDSFLLDGGGKLQGELWSRLSNCEKKLSDNYFLVWVFKNRSLRRIFCLCQFSHKYFTFWTWILDLSKSTCWFFQNLVSVGNAENLRENAKK